MTARHLALIAALTAALTVVGCTDPSLEVSEQPRSEFFLPGSRTFPELDGLTVRVVDAPDDEPDPAVFVTIVTGECRQSTYAEDCGRFECSFELQYDAPSLCLVLLHATFGGGERYTCWYHGLHEIASLDDTAEQQRLAREDHDAWDRCLADIY